MKKGFLSVTLALTLCLSLLPPAATANAGPTRTAVLGAEALEGITDKTTDEGWKWDAIRVSQNLMRGLFFRGGCLPFWKKCRYIKKENFYRGDLILQGRV